MRPRFLLVLVAGLLLAALLLLWPNAERRPAPDDLARGASSAEGPGPLCEEEVVTRRAAQDDSPRLVGRARGRPPTREARLDAQVLGVESREWPLEFRCVEADTGRPFDSDELELAVSAEGRGLESPGSDLRVVQARPEQRVRLSWSVLPPAGRLAWDRRGLTAVLSPYARRLLVVYPLRRERETSIRVEEHDGASAAARILGVQVVGRAVPHDHVQERANGNFSLRGVPHLPGEAITVTAATAKRGYVGTGASTAFIPADPWTPIEILLRLPRLRRPDDSAQVLGSAIGIGGGAGGAFRGRRGRRPLVDVGATVDVEVLRDNGAPAIGAAILLGSHSTRTNPEGRARFVGVRPGHHTVFVRQVGLLPIHHAIDVQAGDQLSIDLREPEPSTLEVRVVDEEGRALPFATLDVTVPGIHPWVDVRDGTQRLAPYVDQDGYRILGGLPDSGVRITAQWGTRHATIGPALARGQTAVATIVLRRHP